MILLAHNSLWSSVLSWIIEIWSLLVGGGHTTLKVTVLVRGVARMPPSLCWCF